MVSNVLPEPSGRIPIVDAVDGAAQPPADGGSATPPSNTVADKCNSPIYPLQLGVDSLYLSYRGALSREREGDLRELKAAAQSDDPGNVFQAQLRVGEHVFEVKDRGSSLFAYVLEDNAFRIALSRSSARSLPMAYVKVSAHRLASAVPSVVESELASLLREFGDLEGGASVSRIDLYVDFTSTVDMEGWSRKSWVGRASNVHAHSSNDTFSGWSLGLKGPISARLYDKTLEIKVSRKAWIKDHWLARGWNGSDRVWRLEFQLRRDGLESLTTVDFANVLRELGAIWAYCTGEWVRLCVPSESDNTRTRWRVHPFWEAVQRLDWGTPSSPLVRQFAADRAPEMSRLLRHVLGLLWSFMALRGTYELGEGIQQLWAALDEHMARRSEFLGIGPRRLVFEQVALRVRKFNLGLNADEIPDEDRLHREGDGLAEEAAAYRRASRGG